jgi:MFS family permease
MTVAGRTCLFDSLRLCFQGALDSVFLSVALLIALRFFHAPLACRGLLSCLAWVGALTTPFLVRLFASTGLRAARLAALVFALTAIFLACAALARSLTFYVLNIAIASVFFRSEGAFLSRIYGDNYSPDRRGSLMAPGLILTALMAIVFCRYSGSVLDRSLENSRIVLLAAAGCALLCAFALLPIPSTPLWKGKKGPRESYFALFVRNPLFTKMSLYFTLVGFAYQMLIPMRVEHLADCRRGWNWDNSSLMLLAWVIPSIARVLCTQPIALLFDRLSIIATRLTVNALFLAGILLFFESQSFPFLAAGSALLGAAMAGSYVMHNLWLTKVVPLEDLPAYTALYLLLTGIRSVLAPAVSYGLLAFGTAVSSGRVAVILLVIASWGFWSLRRDLAAR